MAPMRIHYRGRDRPSRRGVDGQQSKAISHRNWPQWTDLNIILLLTLGGKAGSLPTRNPVETFLGHSRDPPGQWPPLPRSAAATSDRIVLLACEKFDRGAISC